MLDLPIPKSRHGWFAAIILIIVVFNVYYLWVYPHVLDFYERQLFLTYQASSLDDPERQDLIINVKVPRYLSIYVKRWAFIQLENGGDHTIEDIRIDLCLSPENQIPILLPPVFEEKVSDQGVYFEAIEPKATIYGRIPLFVSNNDERDIILLVNGSETPFKQAVPYLKVELWQSFRHSFIENLLLPPWANGIMAFAVLVICYLVDRREVEGKGNEPNLLCIEGLVFVGRVILEGLGVILVSCGILMLVIWGKWLFILFIGVGVLLLLLAGIWLDDWFEKFR